jgi:hypothetical protein
MRGSHEIDTGWDDGVTRSVDRWTLRSRDTARSVLDARTDSPVQSVEWRARQECGIFVLRRIVPRRVVLGRPNV